MWLHPPSTSSSIIEDTTVMVDIDTETSVVLAAFPANTIAFEVQDLSASESSSTQTDVETCTEISTGTDFRMKLDGDGLRDV